MIRTRKTDWTAACRGRNCCPKIKIEDNTVWIRDDDGCVVKMTLEQLMDICETAKSITKSER